MIKKRVNITTNTTFKNISTNLLRIALVCLMSMNLAHAEALSTIKLSSESWEDATNEDGTGLYWDIIRMVYEPVGIKVEVDTASYARSVALVKQKRADAWVGSYIDEEENIIYPKSHFDSDIVAALFIKKPGNEWLGEQSLKGKNVAWIKGYELHEYIEVEFNKREIMNRGAALGLLKSGRIDYFIDAQVEIKSQFKDALQNEDSLTVEKIKNLNLYLGFANTPKGQKLADIFDERFPIILEDGNVKKLFEKWDYTYTF